MANRNHTTPSKPSPLNINLEESTHRELRMLAASRGTNVASIVRELIATFLSTQNRSY